MHKLVGFDKKFPELIIESDLQRKNSVIAVQFSLQNADKIIGLQTPSFKYVHGKDVPRASQLWTTTCFEFFLSPVGSKSYYEFNFSLLPAWNCFIFDSYRIPKAPRECFDFPLKEFSWDRKKRELFIEIENSTGQNQFRIGITAVIESEIGKDYYALKHCADKPDFHVLESFILERN